MAVRNWITNRRGRVVATILAGAIGGGAAALVRSSARRARRRRERSEQAFHKASDGLWPPIPEASARIVRIGAGRADAAEPDDPEGS